MRIIKHEKNCIHNATKRSCLTCKHRIAKNLLKYECEFGKNIPEGQYYEQCSKYIWDEKTHSTRGVFGSVFDSFFRGGNNA